MRIDMNTPAPTVILANGAFPTHAVPLAALKAAAHIACCDGAANELAGRGIEPVAIVGDNDSLTLASRAKWADRMVHNAGQNDNDLTKAVRFCITQGWRDLVILGATGLREDHTLGNISLLADYAREARVAMLTDTGRFTPLLASATLNSFPGEQVSIFALEPAVAIISQNLKYPLNRTRPSRWWQATLNESTSEKFTLTFIGGAVIVFQCYKDTAERIGP
jgi:thiamine pyrophosphokinase